MNRRILEVFESSPHLLFVGNNEFLMNNAQEFDELIDTLFDVSDDRTETEHRTYGVR